MGKILICVDCQYDFIEGGNLPVGGGRKAMNWLSKFVVKNADCYDAVVCTLDWHPHGHCSFQNEGGSWPTHCVQHTHGAALYQPLVDALPKAKLHVFLKGCDKKKDEYSFLDSEKNKKKFLQLSKKLRVDEVDLCGIAGDVCVMNTARGLIEAGLGEKLSIVLPAVASLDSDVTLGFIEENSITIKKK